MNRTFAPGIYFHKITLPGKDGGKMKGVGRGILRALDRTPGSLQKFSEHSEFGLELKKLWLGVLAGLGIWLAAALLGLGWIAFSGTGQYYLSLYVYVAGILGVVLGGFAAGRRAVKRGWLHGLWVGILLALCGIIANLELMPHSYTWLGMLRQLVLWSLWGLAGGYLGQLLKSPGRGKTIGGRG